MNKECGNRTFTPSTTLQIELRLSLTRKCPKYGNPIYVLYCFDKLSVYTTWHFNSHIATDKGGKFIKMPSRHTPPF